MLGAFDLIELDDLRLQPLEQRKDRHRAAVPDAFTSHHNTYKEHELHMTTNNQDRVKTV